MSAIGGGDNYLIGIFIGVMVIMGIMFFNECIGSLELGSVVDGKVGVGMFLVSRVLLVLSIENYLGLIVLVIVVVN